MESIEKLLYGIGFMVLGVAFFQLDIISNYKIFSIIGLIALLSGIIFFIAGMRNNKEK